MSDFRDETATGDRPRSFGDPVICVLPPEQGGTSGREIDIAAVVKVVWAGRWIVLLVTVLAGTFGLTYALLAKPWYRAEVVLVPTASGAGQGLAAQLAQFGALANLAGISVGTPNKAEPIAVLQSRAFARAFIEEQDLVTVLLADRWDADLGKWKGDPKIEPDIRDAVEFFTKHVRTVEEDRKTGLVTLKVDWHDPQLAAAWADTLVRRLNAQMRDRALTDAEANISYLQKELTATNVVSLQQSIGRLLEAELQKLMLARGNEQFSFRIVDPAQVPKKKLKPHRAIIVLGSLLFGTLLGVAAALVRGRLGLARNNPAPS